MKIVINNASFQYLFYDEKTALERLHNFIYICKELESSKLKNVDGIISDYIDVLNDIVPGRKLITLLQRFETQDEKRYLLGLLTNRPGIPKNEKMLCIMAGRKTCIWSQIFDNMLVSLLSEDVFEDNEIEIHLEEDIVKIRNISQQVHIEYYSNELGKRIYIPNDGKHKKDRENFYGKGKTASIMDLEQEEAQELLDRAVWVNGRLYGRKNGIDYAFQNTQDNIYHGYQVSDLSDNIKTELKKYKW